MVRARNMQLFLDLGKVSLIGLFFNIAIFNLHIA